MRADEKLTGFWNSNPSNFVTRIDNPYFPLTPGTTFIYEGQTAQGFEHDEFAVTRNTRVIQGVTCVACQKRIGCLF